MQPCVDEPRALACEYPVRRETATPPASGAANLLRWKVERAKRR